MKTIAGAILILTAAVLFMGAVIVETMPRAGGKPELPALIGYFGGLGTLLMGLTIFIVGLATESLVQAVSSAAAAPRQRRYADDE